jgi:hypothetical protein
MSTTPPEPKLPVRSAAEMSEGELQPEDFYMDGPYLVFTAEYHRKRGYCCNSGCRHCPYDSD